MKDKDEKSMWFKNTKGKPDAMLTFAIIAFSVVTLNIFLSTFGTIAIAGYSISFVVLDSAIIGTYLGATFTAYVSRRFTDSRMTQDTVPSKYREDEKKLDQHAEELDSHTMVD